MTEDHQELVDATAEIAEADGDGMPEGLRVAGLQMLALLASRQDATYAFRLMGINVRPRVVRLVSDGKAMSLRR
jgi:hypothetical protein